jgi:hypothetical protein
MPCRVDRRSSLLGVLAVAAALTLAALPARALADVDPAGCTPDLQYDPTIPTYNATLGLPLGGGRSGSQDRQTTAVLQAYQHAVAHATENNPRVRVIEKKMSDTALGKEVIYSVVGTPENIANLDAGRNDAAFWRGVREGTIDTDTGLGGVRTRPAFTWVTATPHGGEPAAGEASMRLLYELAARMDCSNVRRLQNLDTFIVPVTNPDGRDGGTVANPGQRQTAWGFDPNRDRGTRVNIENDGFARDIAEYPGVFVIDAHQQSNGYFFPPNEDGVHHEISNFAIDFIQNDIGPFLQRLFNDQDTTYRNYNSYDLFAPEYGDSVPALLDGAAGMTYEKGNTEVYGKQVYDHYLAMDGTENLTSDQKVSILTGWVKQWGEAVQQGADCELQPNKLVSPLHTQILTQPPSGPAVCGYYFLPGRHTGDTARLMRELISLGVHVYKLDDGVGAAVVHVFGSNPTSTRALPAGTLYVPMAQGQKHWIQAILGENPYPPFPYNYDVATWSYPLVRGLAGDGFVTQLNLPAATRMTEISDPGFGAVNGGAGKAVYAFDGDSAQGLAMAMDLLGRGAKVFRAAASFDAAGHHFLSGALLVDGTTVGGIDLSALSSDRQTPLYGLDNYPVSRQLLDVPKVGLYTGGTTVPANPASVGGTRGLCPSGGYCESLFVLNQKVRIPASQLFPVTSTDLANGRLVTDHFTALVNPGSTIAAGAGATALQAFVNQGGRYIGTAAGGTTSARNAGMTNINTIPTTAAPFARPGVTGIDTTGSMYDGVYTTSNPLAWGFDTPPEVTGAHTGWIYRESDNDPAYNRDTFTASAAGAFPAPTVALEYPALQAGQTTMYNYGYDDNASGPGQLEGRPAAADQPFGAGHALMLGFNPFYRAWIDGEERLVLNGVLYPTGAPVGPTAPAAAVVRAAAPVAAPVAKKALPTVKSRPISKQASPHELRITVKRSQGAQLRKAVKAAKMSKRMRKRVHFVTTRKSVSLVMKGARSSNEENRQLWVGQILGRLKAHGIIALQAKI